MGFVASPRDFSNPEQKHKNQRGREWRLVLCFFAFVLSFRSANQPSRTLWKVIPFFKWNKEKSSRIEIMKLKCQWVKDLSLGTTLCGGRNHPQMDQAGKTFYGDTKAHGKSTEDFCSSFSPSLLMFLSKAYVFLSNVSNNGHLCLSLPLSSLLPYRHSLPSGEEAPTGGRHGCSHYWGPGLWVPRRTPYQPGSNHLPRLTATSHTITSLCPLIFLPPIRFFFLEKFNLKTLSPSWLQKQARKSNNAVPWRYLSPFCCS